MSVYLSNYGVEVDFFSAPEDQAIFEEMILDTEVENIGKVLSRLIEFGIEFELTVLTKKDDVDANSWWLWVFLGVFVFGTIVFFVYVKKATSGFGLKIKKMLNGLVITGLKKRIHQIIFNNCTSGHSS